MARMLDLPGLPVLDKIRLVGGCLRLPLKVDAARLRAEFDALPPDLWGSRGGRVGVHEAADAIFLRGYAPAEGDKPVEDRPALEHLPYVREIVAMLGAPPLRCLLARLPPHAVVASHIDKAPYFAKALRVHVPIVTHEQVWMYCDGLSYHMRVGEAWVLNNSAVHGVWNASPDQPRTHMICDFMPSPALLATMARGERGLGIDDPGVKARLAGGVRMPGTGMQ